MARFQSLRVFQDLGPPPLKGKVLEGRGRFGSDFLQNGTKRGKAVVWSFKVDEFSYSASISACHLATNSGTPFLLGTGGFHLEGPTKKSGLEKHENIIFAEID